MLGSLKNLALNKLSLINQMPCQVSGQRLISQLDCSKEPQVVISPPTSSSPSSIRVTQSHENYYIWDACDALRLRREFRIVGYHVGCLPTAGLQLNTCGLPLQLLPQELGLLVSLGAASITRVERSKPESSLLQEFAHFKATLTSDYLSLSLEEKTHQILKNRDSIITKYKTKETYDKSKSDEEIVQEKIDTIIKGENRNDKAPVQVHTSCPFKPFIMDTVELKSHLFDTKFHVYKDLWNRGFFITSGSKFACDFLVYELDPLICHSKFMVVCLDFSLKGTALRDSLSSQIKGRLSVQVNKRLVFAFVRMASSGREDVSVEYEELTWRGKHQVKNSH